VVGLRGGGGWVADGGGGGGGGVENLDCQIIRDTKMQHSTGGCFIATLLPPVLPTTEL